MNELCVLHSDPIVVSDCRSHIGKRLMAKCRLLLNENEELGRTISSGSVAKLESTIALEKKLSQEMRKAEKGLDPFPRSSYSVFTLEERCGMEDNGNCKFVWCLFKRDGKGGSRRL